MKLKNKFKKKLLHKNVILLFTLLEASQEPKKKENKKDKDDLDAIL